MSRPRYTWRTGRLVAECVAIPVVALGLAVAVVCWWRP